MTADARLGNIAIDLDRAAAALEARRLDLVARRDRLEALAATLTQRAESLHRAEAEVEARERAVEARRSTVARTEREFELIGSELASLSTALDAFVGQSEAMLALAAERVVPFVERHRRC